MTIALKKRLNQENFAVRSFGSNAPLSKKNKAINSCDFVYRKSERFYKCIYPIVKKFPPDLVSDKLLVPYLNIK